MEQVEMVNHSGSVYVLVDKSDVKKYEDAGYKVVEKPKTKK